MLRRSLLFCGSSAASLVKGLQFETVSDHKSLEPTIDALLRATEQKQGLKNIPDVNRRDFALAARTPNGKIAGHLLGFTNYNELHVAMLAANPEVTVRGTGSTLLRAAEMLAREKYGCNRVGLETFTWQARPFYEKVGFKVFAEQENQPKGEKKFFMEKVWAVEDSKAPVTSYKGASDELKIVEWGPAEALKSLNLWLDDHALILVPDVPPYNMTPFAMKVTDAHGALVACCAYDTWWNELHIEKLVVDPEKQKHGIGAAVLKRMEEMAREKKLQHLVADAMSWQSREFYEKRGFHLYATQKDLPIGHSRMKFLRVLE